MKTDKLAAMLTKMVENPDYIWSGWLVIPGGGQYAARDFRKAGFNVKVVEDDVIVGKQPTD